MYLKKYLLKIATGILDIGNGYPTPLTDQSNIKSLMHNLSPQNFGNNLIRLGPEGDGGYIVPDDLVGIEACFSPGVCFESGFEKDCAELGMKVFMADRSVEKPADCHDLFTFTKKYVGVTTNSEFMTVDDWVSQSLTNKNSDLLLQIDIEGYEYETFLGMSDSLMRRFRVIVAEFHDLEELWNRPFFKLASRAFQKILQTHTCVHIHPNNCSPPLNKGGLSIPPVAEFTFLRNDRIHNSSFVNDFPHPLDFDNTNNPHFPLPACWYAKR